VTMFKVKKYAASGDYATASLFIELNRYKDPCTAELSFINDDDEFDEELGKEIKSLKKLYISYSDPSEYDFAMEVFGSFECWDKMRTGMNKFSTDIYPSWRKEFEQRMLSQHLKSIVNVAVDDTHKQKLEATKYLIDKGVFMSGVASDTEKRGKGRPPKDEIEKAVKLQMEKDKEFSDDFKRLKLVVSNGKTS